MNTPSNIRLQITPGMVSEFAAMTGDSSSLHMDPEFGRHTPFGTNIVHGMLSVAFISAFTLPEPSGRMLRRLSARFARPVFRNDCLDLRTTTTASGNDVTAVEFSFQKDHGMEVITGRLELAHSVSADHGSARNERRPIPLSLLQEQNRQPDEINKGDECRFPFAVTPSHRAWLKEILHAGLIGPPASFVNGVDTTNLLGASMISPCIGMCVPGRLGLLTNFDIAFQSSLELNQCYEFIAQVVFKSAAAATVVETFSIVKANTGETAATGKITSKINSIQQAAANQSTTQDLAEKGAALL